MSATDFRLLIVGNPGGVHVGRHLREAAHGLGIPVELVSSDDAYQATRAVRALNWHLRGHRPARLIPFGTTVLERCRQWEPDCVLTTGLAPLERGVLDAIGSMGIRRINFLTDDPWNPAHHAPWFMQAITAYDEVYSPRAANLDDLKRLGCRSVSYLPFAYAPDMHFTEAPEGADDAGRFSSDVIFIGGADRDRVAWIAPLIEAGLRVALYGGYWENYSATRSAARGMADPRAVRKAIGGAATALCLVRRGNRDGHSMRSFEVPAIGACIVAEDTKEHRAIFGDDGALVVYVRDSAAAIDRIRMLLADAEAREHLRTSAKRFIMTGGHTWADRLLTMMARLPIQGADIDGVDQTGRTVERHAAGVTNP